MRHTHIFLREIVEANRMRIYLFKDWWCLDGEVSVSSFHDPMKATFWMFMDDLKLYGRMDNLGQS